MNNPLSSHQMNRIRRSEESNRRLHARNCYIRESVTLRTRYSLLACSQASCFLGVAAAVLYHTNPTALLSSISEDLACPVTLFRSREKSKWSTRR